MSNKELSHLSGVKLSNLGRTRQKVLDTCEVDGTPLFIYVSQGRHRAGKYMINFNLTSSSRQKPPENDNDLNITKQNEEERSSSSSIVNTGSTGKDNEVVLKEVDDLLKIMQEKWKLPSSPSRGRVKRMVDEYGFKRCVDAVDRSADGINTWTKILNYVAKVLKSAGESLAPGEVQHTVMELKEALELLLEQRKNLEAAPDDRSGQWRTESRESALSRIDNRINEYETKIAEMERTS